MAGSPCSHKTREPRHIFCGGNTMGCCECHEDSSVREGRGMLVQVLEGVEQI